MAPWRSSRLAVSLVPGRRAAAASEHRALFEAIRCSDDAAAEKLMSSHLEHLEQSMAELVDGREDGMAKASSKSGAQPKALRGKRSNT